MLCLSWGVVDGWATEVAARPGPGVLAGADGGEDDRGSGSGGGGVDDRGRAVDQRGWRHGSG